ncbi:Fe3+ hydroxamate ABC transporter substrate-binding protein [Bacillus weihaiensis]|uniref:Fe3+ hydroxamate ABC transporter substrate-binding protein n=1 Tax=Bacillus weihaiensis TaxID=1547283 RepID=A0A1L3MTK9_9BACI|nr:Fe3+ hydroxamate ABC transporter substrate-binding protein [Bacillus weihaiensis]APH05669.1 Fe3+ hydroxamate ABC transporter substrate-binding protein [Bacillus weihaiensis]
MFNEKPKCSNCNKEIKNEEEVYIKLKWPKRRGFTEIKAFLRNEGSFICEECSGRFR